MGLQHIRMNLAWCFHSKAAVPQSFMSSESESLNPIAPHSFALNFPPPMFHSCLHYSSTELLLDILQSVIWAVN